MAKLIFSFDDKSARKLKNKKNILGGKGAILGPVLGTTTLMITEEIFQMLTKHWQLLTGLVIVLVALFFPNGLAGIRIFKKGRST